MERVHRSRLVDDHPLLRVTQVHTLVVISLLKWLSVNKRRRSSAGHAERQRFGVRGLVLPFVDVVKKRGLCWILFFFFGPLCVVATVSRFHYNVDDDRGTSLAGGGWRSWTKSQYTVASGAWRPNQNIHAISRRQSKVVLAVERRLQLRVLVIFE